MKKDLEDFKKTVQDILNDKSKIGKRRSLLWSGQIILKSNFFEKSNGIKENSWKQDVGHDLNFMVLILPIVWNLADDEYIKTVYGVENIPNVFSRVPYECLNQNRNDFMLNVVEGVSISSMISELFEIIGKGMVNMEMQSNGLLTLWIKPYFLFQ